MCLCNLGPPWFIEDKMTPEQFIAWPASGDMKLRCPADGEPPLKYQWLKDGKPITYRRLDAKYVSERLYSENCMVCCIKVQSYIQSSLQIAQAVQGPVSVI